MVNDGTPHAFDTDLADVPTQPSNRGDAADQADHLRDMMFAEALRNARAGRIGDGDLEGSSTALEDTEAVIIAEDADDASDDPMHAGGIDVTTLADDQWVPAEIAAMHVVDPRRPEAPSAGPTPEDQTLRGIDPYEPDRGSTTHLT